MANGIYELFMLLLGLAIVETWLVYTKGFTSWAHLNAQVTCATYFKIVKTRRRGKNVRDKSLRMRTSTKLV